jgi:hypothetical protein
MGEEFGESETTRRSVKVGEDDVDVAGILPQKLSAWAARRGWLRRIGDDRDLLEGALTGGDG